MEIAESAMTMAKPEAYARVLLQILRMLGDDICLEILRRSDDRKALARISHNQDTDLGEGI